MPAATFRLRIPQPPWLPTSDDFIRDKKRLALLDDDSGMPTPCASPQPAQMMERLHQLTVDDGCPSIRDFMNSVAQIIRNSVSFESLNRFELRGEQNWTWGYFGTALKFPSVGSCYLHVDGKPLAVISDHLLTIENVWQVSQGQISIRWIAEENNNGYNNEYQEDIDSTASEELPPSDTFVQNQKLLDQHSSLLLASDIPSSLIEHLQTLGVSKTDPPPLCWRIAAHLSIVQPTPPPVQHPYPQNLYRMQINLSKNQFHLLMNHHSLNKWFDFTKCYLQTNTTTISTSTSHAFQQNLPASDSLFADNEVPSVPCHLEGSDESWIAWGSWTDLQCIKGRLFRLLDVPDQLVVNPNSEYKDRGMDSFLMMDDETNEFMKEFESGELPDLFEGMKALALD